MRPAFRRAVLVAILVSVLPLVGAGPTRGGTPPTPLAGWTTVRAEAPTWTRVELPQATEISTLGGRSPDVDIWGRGRSFGVVLVPEKAELAGQTLVMLVAGGCWERGCLPEPPFRQFETVWAVAWPNQRKLPTGEIAFMLKPGTYRLTAVADGAPMTARIRLPGLPGQIELAPKQPVKYRHITVESTAPVAGSVSPYRMMSTEPFEVTTQLGFMYAVHGERWAPHVAGSAGDCFFRNSRPLAEMYVPGCPMGFDMVQHSMDYPGPEYYGMAAVMKPTTEPGSWTHGAWKAAVGVPSWVRMTQLWMEMGEQQVIEK